MSLKSTASVTFIAQTRFTSLITKRYQDKRYILNKSANITTFVEIN